MKSPADMKIIQIDITNACHKRCSNCTRFCGHHTEPFYMDFETFKQAVDSMKGFDGIVGIMGGEPTIHPEFEKFVRYYREHIGYDDFSTACYQPTADFVNHILANTYNVDYHNQRGLWTSVTPKYYENFELIQDTFGYQLVNDHSHESMHETMMCTRKELGIPDDEWVKLRDNCWVQNLWSASITPKGAFFCEVAAAMDATLGGPGGWKIEPGWWNRKPADFADQLHWCELCSAALPMPKRNANEEVDDVSPVWREKLIQIGSPKLAKGLVSEFNPMTYNACDHEVIAEETPYLEDQEQRIGASKNILEPWRIVSVAWLTETIREEEATRILDRLKANKRLNFVVSTKADHEKLAESAGVPFLDAAGRTGAEIYAELKEKGKAKDWILLMRDCAPSDQGMNLFKTCVFNPGCIYEETVRNKQSKGLFQFFNVRAHSLAAGGDLFQITTPYPPRKVIRLVSDRIAKSKLSRPKRAYREAMRRVRWAQKRVARKLADVAAAAL